MWHGNVFRARQIGDDLEEDLEMLEAKNASIQKLLQAVREFNDYIRVNGQYIVNYGDRYRNGEIISTAFVESTVNEVISKIFVKKQQMRCKKRGSAQFASSANSGIKWRFLSIILQMVSWHD